MLPSKDLGLNSQSLCTPCIRCHVSQRDDTRQLTDLLEVTTRIEGEGHGPLLPPSKDGHLPNQNLPQSVTPKTVTDRKKEDKQGTPLVKGHSESAFGSRRKRAGCAWCVPRARSRGLTPSRLMKKQSRDKTAISQASSARRESIHAKNPGATMALLRLTSQTVSLIATSWLHLLYPPTIPQLPPASRDALANDETHVSAS